MPSTASEAEFLLSCIMHTEGKTDFEAVAKETGYTNTGSAFNRLTSLKRGFLAKNNSTGTGITKSTTASPVKKKAPATPRKARKSTLKRVEREDDSISDGAGSGSKGSSKAVKTAS
ncbi:uncharacterized protein H6S33_011191 [Morchella sextelata]|uniref:uncharacterized protein n=1 Tax=Morchella sextelata TaxID=1174677 RepID=UPI001D0562DE|nr:uncharacterized protein H6S33_011191 [Morchella sextelata]KAH0610764.1 hypothetical protein H6S33_011191 [Morchella sextelata]